MAITEGSGSIRNFSFWTMEIDSTPPPMAIVMPSAMICLAAIAIAMRRQSRAQRG